MTIETNPYGKKLSQSRFKDYDNYGLIPDKMRALRQQHEIETVMRLAS